MLLRLLVTAEYHYLLERRALLRKLLSCTVMQVEGMDIPRHDPLEGSPPAIKGSMCNGERIELVWASVVFIIVLQKLWPNHPVHTSA